MLRSAPVRAESCRSFVSSVPEKNHRGGPVLLRGKDQRHRSGCRVNSPSLVHPPLDVIERIPPLYEPGLREKRLELRAGLLDLHAREPGEGPGNLETGAGRSRRSARGRVPADGGARRRVRAEPPPEVRSLAHVEKPPILVKESVDARACWNFLEPCPGEHARSGAGSLTTLAPRRA